MTTQQATKTPENRSTLLPSEFSAINTTMAPGRRRKDADEDEEDEQPQNRRKSGAKRGKQQESEAESDGGSDAGGRSQGRNRNMEGNLAFKLVRFAIACEYARSPVRREAVREKGA